MRKSWLAVVAIWALGCSADPSGGTAAPVTPEVVTRTIDATVAQCPYGGSVVEAGLDVDGDGALSDGEVETQRAVCLSAPTEPPPPAPQIVIRLVDEPAGPRCAIRGTAVESGPDDNGNGVLDDGEVDHIDYICSDVVVGDLSISGKAQLGAFANLRGVTGSLTLSVIEVSALVSLPRLVQVGGAMMVTSARNIGFPELVAVNRNLSLAHAAHAQFPKLVRVGSMSLFNAEVADLSGFPALQRIDDSLSIGASGVSKIDLALDILGSLKVNNDGNLTEINLQVNHSTGDIDIHDNGSLTSLVLGIGGVASLEVERNPQLPTCQVEAIAQRLSLTDARISGNDDSATCPP